MPESAPPLIVEEMGASKRLAAALSAMLLAGCALPPGFGGLLGPSCTVSDKAGTELLSGTPDEVAATIGPALADPKTQLQTDLRRALSGGPALTCSISRGSFPDEVKEPPLGLTPRAQDLRAEVRRVFGKVSDGGFAPTEELQGREPGSLHTRGRAIDFFFRPYEDPAKVRAGWRLANWLVANAPRLGVQTVIYQDHIWTTRRSSEGWRDYTFYGQDKTNPINRHLDHVHVDVF